MSYHEPQRIDRRWGEYPIGTKAHAVMGGHWLKTEHGWKWCTGSTFPRPGGDAISVSMPRPQRPAAADDEGEV